MTLIAQPHFYHSPVYGSIWRECLWSKSLPLVVVPRFSLYRRHKAACSLHGTNSTIILIANAAARAKQLLHFCGL